jgi:serine acetyltransferase
LGDITIGSNSVIAANAVVSKSYPENSIIAGCPGKIIGKTNIDYKAIVK